MTAQPTPSLEAKLVLLGSQSVGKTALLTRHIHSTFHPPTRSTPTIGASFHTHRAHDPETNTTLRLQIWDTAGQERFRSISRLYYRGANAVVLCYDVTDRRSFEALGGWLEELRQGVGGGCGGHGLGDLVVHVVGTKVDLVQADPGRREVGFERCLGFVAEELFSPGQQQQQGFGGVGSPPTAMGWGFAAANGGPGALSSPVSNRSSGLWGQEHEALYTSCHEVSAANNEGVDEVFRIITQKLVLQQQRRAEHERLAREALMKTPGGFDGPGYFDLPGGGNGSFRLGHAGGDKRRSWLGFPTTPGGLTNFGDEGDTDDEAARGRREGRCC
ncbi:hypothetical protein MBLNU230_g5349t1 [Neophaeotheca triangularis]